MDSRYILICKTLIKQNKCSLNFLTSVMNLNVKTILKLIEQYKNYETDYGYCISINDSIISCSIVNKQLFQSMIDKHEADINQQRINEIIQYLIEANDYLKIESIAQRLFVSRVTIDRLIPLLKEKLKEYNLTLVSKPKYGIALEGKESYKRICYAQCVNNNIFASQDFLVIQSIITSVLLTNKMLMADINSYNLMLHCYIAIKRIFKGILIEDIDDSYFQNTYPNEYKCALDIANTLANQFNIDFPNSEISYIGYHLLGKHIYDSENMIDFKIFECVDAIVSKIKTNMGVDLSNDLDFKSSLALHLQPLVARACIGTIQKNQLIQRIKSEMFDAFEAAIIASDVIHDFYGITINEHEIGYIALHISLAFEKRGESSNTGKPVILVCSSGLGMAKLLQHKLVAKYNFNDTDFKLVSVFELDYLVLEDYSCIISVVPLSKQYPIPVYYTDFKLTDLPDNLFEHIDDDNCLIHPNLIIIHPKVNTKDEIIQCMCETVRSTLAMDESLYDQILKREQLSSTEIGNALALPHPLEYEKNSSYLVLLTLTKPILWKETYVRIVLMPLLSPVQAHENNKINQFILNLSSNITMIERLYQCNDKSSIISVLRELS